MESIFYAGDELLSDSFQYKEILNGILWEVDGKVNILVKNVNFFYKILFLKANKILYNAFPQWVVKGALDVDIGANPSAEGGEEDEGVNDEAVKVVDIVDTFRLQVSLPMSIFLELISKLALLIHFQ